MPKTIVGLCLATMPIVGVRAYDVGECDWFTYIFNYIVDNNLTSQLTYNWSADSGMVWEACGYDETCVDWAAEYWAVLSRSIHAFPNSIEEAAYEAVNGFSDEYWMQTGLTIDQCVFDMEESCDDENACNLSEEGYWVDLGNGIEEWYMSEYDGCYCLEIPQGEYRCAAGYIGYPIDGQTGCTEYECPDGSCCGIVVNGDDGTPLVNAQIYIHAPSDSPNPYAGGEYRGVFSGEDGIFEMDYCMDWLDSNDGSIWMRVGGLEGYTAYEQEVNDPYATITAKLYEDQGNACASNEYRIWSGNRGVCRSCPSQDGAYGINTTNSFQHMWYRKVDCYMPTTQTFTDTTGTWHYADRCYYSN